MHRSTGSRALIAVVAMVLAAPVARAGIFEDVNIGFAVSIEAPDQYSAHVPFAVTGFLRAQFALPVVVEVAAGVPDEQIDVLVDDEVITTVTTAGDGSYEAILAFGTEPPLTRSIKAVAYRGSALETSSRTVVTTIDRAPIELFVSPSSASIARDHSIQLTALVTDNQGRTSDVTSTAHWSSADPDVASVSSAVKGLVSGIAPGTATIWAELDGLAASATITVA